MTTSDQAPLRRASDEAFIKALGLWDVVAMNIVAVVGLRWIARSARLGAPSVSLWILALVVFAVPLALALIELSSRHPEQGGIYAWVRRAFGPLHGFIAGWCLWVNNIFYFPSLLLFGAANFALVLGPAGAAPPRGCPRRCSPSWAQWHLQRWGRRPFSPPPNSCRERTC